MQSTDTNNATDAKPARRTIRLTSDDTGYEYEFAWPQTHHISRFTREVSANPTKAHNNMVMDLRLAPEKEVLLERIKEKPGLVVALGNEIGKACGLTEEFTVKN